MHKDMFIAPWVASGTLQNRAHLLESCHAGRLGKFNFLLILAKVQKLQGQLGDQWSDPKGPGLGSSRTPPKPYFSFSWEVAGNKIVMAF